VPGSAISRHAVPSAKSWGRLRVDAGRPLPSVDALLAATAITHNLTLVTRNTADFNGIPALKILNPWIA